MSTANQIEDVQRAAQAALRQAMDAWEAVARHRRSRSSLPLEAGSTPWGRPPEAAAFREWTARLDELIATAEPLRWPALRLCVKLRDLGTCASPLTSRDLSLAQLRSEESCPPSL